MTRPAVVAIPYKLLILPFSLHSTCTNYSSNVTKMHCLVKMVSEKQKYMIFFITAQESTFLVENILRHFLYINTLMWPPHCLEHFTDESMFCSQIITLCLLQQVITDTAKFQNQGIQTKFPILELCTNFEFSQPPSKVQTVKSRVQRVFPILPQNCDGTTEVYGLTIIVQVQTINNHILNLRMY